MLVEDRDEKYGEDKARRKLQRFPKFREILTQRGEGGEKTAEIPEISRIPAQRGKPMKYGKNG